jgi:aminopeptidase YwaD
MKIRLTLLLCLIANLAFAQDSVFARRMVDTLTSRYFWGRGYTNDGMGKAARFITSQFKNFGLQPIAGNSFIQEFDFPVNSFPGKMQVSINGKALIPGRDFIVGPESMGVKATGNLLQRDSVTYVNAENKIIVVLKVADYTLVQVDKKALSQPPASVNLNIENKLISNFKAGNICALVKGTAKPDSVVVFTGHYDHLGGMGRETYFPGANDNASGMAMVLSLAKYYAAHPQPYTVAFICFAGEEAGIIGSKYFTEHPLIQLSNIKLLINMDIMGTGNEGITVVNATVYSKYFDLLKQVNTQGNYLVKINPRGKAANSDHYWFTEKGVPAIFMYTMGGIKAYHDVFDISKTLPLTEFKDLFKLLVQFNAKLQRQ